LPARYVQKSCYELGQTFSGTALKIAELKERSKS
jgi:hypothetical protein